MTKKIHRSYALGIILLTLVTFGVWTWARQEAARAQDISVYEVLIGNARKGDAWSADYLLQVQNFLQSRGESNPPQENKIYAGDTVSGAELLLKGTEPYFIKIYNSTRIDSSEKLVRYISSRRAALEELSNKNPDRLIEVSVSFQGYIDLDRIWKIRDEFGLDIDQLTVHFFSSKGWIAVMGVGDPKAPGEKPVLDFSASASAAKERLKELLPPTKQIKKFEPKDLKSKIPWLRGKIRAKDAMSLDSQEWVILVDPITDLSDAYANRTLDLEVVSMPNLLKARDMIVAQSKTQTQQGAPHPTLNPIKAGN